MEGFVVDGRARELGLDLDRLVGDLFHGWRWRAGGLVAVYIRRGAAGVFVGGLSLWWVRVLAYTEGFPDASSMEFGIFDLLEGLGGWGVSVSGLDWFNKTNSFGTTSGSRSPKTLQTSRRAAPANRVSEVWLDSFP